MTSARKSLTAPELGNYLTGEKVTDADICGQNQLFYGIVRFPSLPRCHAYVKLLPPRQMFAEILSATIGRQLGLPIPYTAPVIARGSDMGLSTGVVIGLASVDGGAMPISRIVRVDEVSTLLNKWSHLRAAVIFDELIANGDRHLKNILLGSEGDIWLIDHEEAFGDPLGQPSRKIFNHLLARAIDDLNVFQRRRASQLINEKILAVAEIDFDLGALSSLPSACRVTDSHVASVVEFLKARVHHMPALLSSGLGQAQKHLDLK